MKKFRLAALLSCTLLVMTACNKISQDKNIGGSSFTSGVSDESVQETTEETVSYTEYVAEVPEIENTDTKLVLETEKCEIGGSLYVNDERKGFSGDGYVTGFYGGSKDKISVSADIPTTQHYDVTVCVAADSNVTNTLIAADKEIGSFDIKKGDNFVRVTFYGIFLEKGENVFSIKQQTDNNFDIDYIEIVNNKTVYDNEFEFEDEPCNPKSTPEAADLLKFMQDSSGKKIITGQFTSDRSNKELDMIYKTTGKYPAIRFGDIGGYNDSDSKEQIAAAEEWAKMGGIVGFMWYWNAPTGVESVYSKETSFSLKKAMTDMNIAELSETEIEKMYSEGGISEECYEIIKDIDKVSSSINELAEKNIPVLWRPLHEAGGEWYWWGSDGAKAYKWLYDLMYRRMTDYHKLDNLIWIWNGQSEDYIVDSSQYDIAAVDIYLADNAVYSSRSEQYQWLKKITGGNKLIALSECSSVPSIDDMLRDNSLWSFFGLWFGDYLLDKEGNLSEIYTKKEELIKIYNAENSVTLDNYAGAFGYVE